MKHEILLLPEVAKRLRISTASVNRLLTRRRNGEDELFPLPISNPHVKAKGRWLARDVDEYIELLSSVNTAKAAPVPISPSKQRQEAKAYRERQQRAEQALQRHRINRKGKQES